MLEKLDLYDVVTSLLHGTLLLASGLVLFPQAMDFVRHIELPEIVLSIMFVSTAYFFGQVITALSSMIQPFLFWTWGGMPSKRVFSEQFPEKYLSSDLINRAKDALQRTSDVKLSDAALFSKAMAVARKAEGSLSERHNQMYAYNRTTLINLILILGLFVCSFFGGICKDFSVCRIIIVSVGFVLLLILHWHRARQRSFYYVREVLVVAERELSGGV